MRFNIRNILGYAFWAAAAWLIVRSPFPAAQNPPREAAAQLLLGGDKDLPEFGATFAPFKPFLPRKGRISFIMDYPFHPYGTTIEQLYTAQSYLVPLILNPEPGEKQALVFCSSAAVAERRLSETGYRMTMVLADGKGLAEKI